MIVVKKYDYTHTKLANPSPKKEGATPTPRRKGQPQPKKSNPRGGRANPNLKGRPHPKNEGPTPTPRRKGQPQLQAREGPTVTPRKKSNPYPRKATQEKEIPTSTQRADPTPRRKSQPQLQASYTLGSGLAGPWPSHSPLLGWTWLSPLLGRGPGQPRPEGPTPARRANPDPEKGLPPPKREKGQPQTRRRKGQPQPQGPIPVLFSPTLGFDYHCVIVIKIMIETTQSWTTPTQRRKGQPRPWPRERRADPTPRRKSQPRPWEGTTATPRRKGQPRPQEGRANPNFLPEKGQPSPRERSPTPTQEKQPKRRKFQPQPKGPTPPQEGRANPNFKPPLLLGQAWPSPTRSGPSPFLLAGPWPSLSLLFGWPSPLRPGQPDPKGQPSPEKEGPTFTRERRPTPTQGREGQPDRKGQPQTGKGRGKTRSENCQHLPKEEGPTSTPRKKGQNPQREKEKPKRKKTTHMKNSEN